jgi:tRNA dimethylallyltransferase
MLKTVFCLMGPTASGKTALACELVKQFPFEIISVDSAMIYRGMDIGTAKPSAKELAAAPHFLIDVIDPPQSFSAAEFCAETRRLCDLIIGRGNLPLLVGGTMMYFHALQRGLASLPDADDALRERLLAEANQKGWAQMHAQLQQVDPVSAARIHPHDTQRIQRALEVFYLTGKPMATSWSEQTTNSSFQFINIRLMPEDRAWLHARIASRFELMLQAGFLDEVRQLLETWQLPPTCPAMRCVGYRQALDFLAGKEDYASFSAKAIAATRQLAKRQLTWLRQWPDVHHFDCDKNDNWQKISALIHDILDNLKTY